MGNCEFTSSASACFSFDFVCLRSRTSESEAQSSSPDCGHGLSPEAGKYGAHTAGGPYTTALRSLVGICIVSLNSLYGQRTSTLVQRRSDSLAHVPQQGGAVAYTG